eukprot:1159957-Pelagomonas_calceolata.AAC.17
MLSKHNTLGALAYRHCTEALHRGIAQAHCTDALLRDVAQRHCTETSTSHSVPLDTIAVLPLSLLYCLCRCSKIVLQRSCDRKVNEFIKRVRAAKIHIIIVSYILQRLCFDLTLKASKVMQRGVHSYKSPKNRSVASMTTAETKENFAQRQEASV